MYWSDSIVVAVFNLDSAPDRSAEQDAVINAIGGEVVWRARTVPGLMAIRVERGLSSAASHLLTVSRFAHRAESANSAGFGYAALPNDPQFVNQWGFRNTGQSITCTDSGTQLTFSATPGIDIGIENAWNVRTDCSATVIAVVDSGVWYTHPDLFSNMWTNPGEIPGDNIDNDLNGLKDDVYGANFFAYEWCGTPNPPPGVNDPLDYLPESGLSHHGTPVATVIGAVGNNGVGATGICWQAKIMAVRATTTFTRYDSCPIGSCEPDPDMAGLMHIMAIDYAVAEGAKVINCSWGFASDPVGLYEAVKAARDYGVIVVAVPHNGIPNGLNVDKPLPITVPPTDPPKKYPCVYDLNNIICVANIRYDGMLDPTSHYGDVSVDIAAPGSGSRASSAATGPAPYSYCPVRTCFGGTSAAAPHVTGVIGLVWSHYPGWTYGQVLQRIYDRARALPQLDGLVRTGRMLDATNILP